MKAIVYERYGSPDVLRYADVEAPTPTANQVLVRVRAASINRGDIFALRGTPRLIRLAFGLTRPKATILGRAIAGTVEAVGAAVSSVQVGDEVFGEVAQRGFAEFVVAPADHVARIPVGVRFEQAATLPVAATTALQAVRAGGVQAGQSVLVNGATGSVGPFAVQLAKHQGASVTGVCGTRNTELVRSIGAEHVVDYTREDITRSSTRYDVIIDVAGGHRVRDLRRILAPKGTLASVTGSGGPVLGPIPRMIAIAATSPLVGQHLRLVANSPRNEELTTLATLIADGRLHPVIERTYPLAEAAEALRFVEYEHPGGKVVLTVRSTALPTTTG